MALFRGSLARLAKPAQVGILFMTHYRLNSVKFRVTFLDFFGCRKSSLKFHIMAHVSYPCSTQEEVYSAAVCPQVPPT